MSNNQSPELWDTPDLFLYNDGYQSRYLLFKRKDKCYQIPLYNKNALVITTLFQKPSGKVTLISIKSGEEVTETTSAFDLFAQVVAGEADLTINGNLHKLKKGNSIIIPAHACHCAKSEVSFKMILTVLKCGYD